MKPRHSLSHIPFAKVTEIYQSGKAQGRSGQQPSGDVGLATLSRRPDHHQALAVAARCKIPIASATFLGSCGTTDRSYLGTADNWPSLVWIKIGNINARDTRRL
jgi:hypothetical protein